MSALIANTYPGPSAHVKSVQRLLKAIGVRPFGLSRRFKPVIDFVKAFFIFACCVTYFLLCLFSYNLIRVR